MRLRAKPILWLILAVLAVGAGTGGWYVYQWNARLVRVGDIRIDPLAKIDPERRYDVLVWETDLYIPGVENRQRRAALEAAAAELSELYPNISVQFEYYAPEEFTDRLVEALEAGVGPDIAGLQGGLLLDPTRQIPVTAYMSQETRDDVLPSAYRAIAYEDDIWAWPRWISMSVWVGTAKHLGQIPDLPRLATKELLTHGGDWRSSLSNNPPVAYNAFAEELLPSIVVANTGQALLADDGTVNWSRDDLERAAQVLAELVGAGLAPQDAANSSRTRLSRFWQGRAAVVAPVNPALLHHLLTRSGDVTYDSDRSGASPEAATLRIASAPYSGEHFEGSLGSVAAYAVFRRDNHAGDDHTQAVMLVAGHLSRRSGHWEAATMLTVPAYASGLAAWETDAGLTQDHVDALTTLARRLVTPSVVHALAALEAEAIRVSIQPHVPALLEGKLTPAEYADAAWRDLQSFLASRQPSGSTL